MNASTRPRLCFLAWCPRCGAALVARDGAFGVFIGCAGFADGCRYTMRLDEALAELARQLTDAARSAHEHREATATRGR